MGRRAFIIGLALASSILGLPAHAWVAQAVSMKAVDDLQNNWKMLLADGAELATSAAPLNHPDKEWRKILTSVQYDIFARGRHRARWH